MTNEDRDRRYIKDMDQESKKLVYSQQFLWNR